MGAIEGCRHVDEVIGNAPLSVTREWLAIHNIHLLVHGDDFD